MDTNQDIEHLRLLSIFQYIVAAILAVVSMFPLFHLVIGISLVTEGFPEGANGDQPPAFMGWLFIILPGMMILCGLTMAVCVAMVGSCLRKQRRHLFCSIIAGLECFFVPIGTVLGVFTIVVLMRPSVKELFDVAQPYET